MSNIFQKLFLISYNHIIAQGRPSFKHNGTGLSCLYKSPEGCGCAAAPFIVNYNPDMEYKDFEYISRHFTNDILPEALEQAEFIKLLQRLHDDAVLDAHYDFRANNIKITDEAYQTGFNAKFMECYKTRVAQFLSVYDKYELSLPEA